MSEKNGGIDSGEEQELTEASLEKASGGSAPRAQLDHVGACNFTAEIEEALPPGPERMSLGWAIQRAPRKYCNRRLISYLCDGPFLPRIEYTSTT